MSLHIDEERKQLADLTGQVRVPRGVFAERRTFPSAKSSQKRLCYLFKEIALRLKGIHVGNSFKPCS
jgi:hypothetical protein